MDDLEEDKICSGIYIRQGRKNILLEDLDEISRNIWLNTLEKEGLIRTVNHLCAILNNLNFSQN